MFTSKNVHFNRASEYSRLLGIGFTSDLGKYLGVPLLHKRAVKLTYAPVVSKVQKRLASWKGHFLSKAGRSILIKSVSSAIPAYHAIYANPKRSPSRIRQDKSKLLLESA